ncbi:hypothetical protein BH09BAC5_BH09BAC5_00720 [soil metagenome]
MKKNLQDKLKAYSAVAGSVIAASATAQVNYTDVSPDVMVHDTLVYGLDLNNDGITDFMLSAGTSSSANFALINVVGDTNNAVLGSLYQGVYPMPYSLNNGDSIKANSVTWPLYAPSSGVNYLGVVYGSYTFGNWVGINDKYVGLRIKANGQFYYGWARLSVNSTSDTITLKDYAYEVQPNVGITAGQITGIQNQNANTGIRIHSYDHSLFVHTPKSNEGGVISVYNMNGELISQKEITSNEMILNLEGVSTGMYAVHISQAGVETTSKVYVR